ERYWTLGDHDMVSVLDAPDAETLAAALLKLGSLGNVRTTTLRAFSDDEMRAVIAKVG
ncbi:MAG: GYD domain-containing protein, partial [Solirubrobacteraceae bacterium]